MEQVTNVTFFVTKLRDHPIGQGKILPHYIVENRGIVPLDRGKNNNKPYKDNLCFFRALALHNGCTWKILSMTHNIIMNDITKKWKKKRSSGASS